MAVTEKGIMSAVKKDGCGSLHLDSIYDMMTVR